MFAALYAAAACGSGQASDGSPDATPDGSPDATPDASPVCAVGSTWTTVDDYQLAAGQNAYAFCAGADRSGGVYVFGQSADANGLPHWIVRKSENKGMSWVLADDYTYGGLAAGGSGWPCIYVDASGRVFATGNGTDSAGIHHGLVRRSTDSGKTWTVTLDFNLVGGKDSDAFGMAADAGGNLYLGLNGSDASDVPHWIVRKSGDGGLGWNTIDDFNLAAGKAAFAYAIAVSPAGTIMVSGGATDAAEKAHALIRKSSDGGTTWVKADDFQYAGPGGTYEKAGYQSLHVGPAGEFFGSLFVGDTVRKGHAVVRGTFDQGSTWRTLDDYQLDALQDAAWNGAGFDASGRYYAIGQARDSLGQSHWLVRQTSDQGKTWSTIDDFQYSPDQNTVGGGVHADSAGNVFAVGYGFDAAGKTHWLTRKLSCVAP